jgi:protein farnesyltransferase subunit beta
MDQDGSDFSNTTAESSMLGPTCLLEKSCEDECLPFLSECNPDSYRENAIIHINFLKKALSGLSSGYISMEASRMWLLFWSLHGISILDSNQAAPFASGVVEYLMASQNQSGGFGGAPGHLSHSATTYAGIMAAVTTSNFRAIQVIDATNLLSFYLSMKQSNGSFSVHKGGECDVRGVYTVLAVSSLLKISTPQLLDKCDRFLLACQSSFDGGFSGEPNGESHGGYTYCAIAALVMLNKQHLIDKQRLRNWLECRQTPLGGFQGRCNKLVDSCYSFWIGASCIMYSEYIDQGIHQGNTHNNPLFYISKLRHYLLTCAQVSIHGGFRDKPSKPKDFYHTCYSLSGLYLLDLYEELMESRRKNLVDVETELARKLRLMCLYNVTSDDAVRNIGS